MIACIFMYNKDPNEYGDLDAVVPETPENGARRRILATPSPVAGGSGSGSGSGSSSHEDAAPYARVPPAAARRIRFRSAPQALVLPARAAAAAPVQPQPSRARRTQHQMLRAATRALQQASIHWRTPPRRLRNSARGYDNL